METLALLRLLAVYVGLTALERLTGSGVLRAGVNAFGVLMPALMLAHFALRGQVLTLPRGLLVAYSMLAVGLLLSVLFAGFYEAADLIKLLLAPLFAFLGYSAGAFDREDPAALSQLRALGLVLMLPVAYALLLNWAGSAGELGVFVNRNNAALYLVVLANVLLVMGVRVGAVVLTLTVGALMFSTLGVVIALGVALVASLSFRRYLPAYLAAALLVGLLLFGPVELPVGERLASLWEGVSAITALGLWTSLHDLSYGDLYILTGENSDLSLFFRLKHWEDLLLVWTSDGWASLLFGLGVGSAPLHTEIGLVPHNDYLRLLVEAGPLGFAGFVGIVGWLLVSIGRNALLLSTAAVSIYFFTENLVSNFAAMTLFYWFAGYWARHAPRRVTVVASPAAWGDRPTALR